LLKSLRSTTVVKRSDGVIGLYFFIAMASYISAYSGSFCPGLSRT
jgi:hypothetical protein